MSVEIIFLGTSAMVPTKDRNHCGIFLSFKNNGILMDCGEGIQRQFKIAGISLTKITKILISHWHGDHILGLPGLMQTLGASHYDGVLLIYGPKGIKKFMDYMYKTYIFDRKLEIEVREVDEGKFFENSDFLLESYKLEHKIECVGYKFFEKDRRRIKVDSVKKKKIPEGPLLGKLQQGEDIVFKGEKLDVDDYTYIVKGSTVGYIADTVVCNGCTKIANGCDLLISESTYAEKEEEKADEYMHLTSKQAAMIAQNGCVKRLVLTHVSQRYKDSIIVEEEAKDIFPETKLAHDFMKIEL